MVLENFSCVPLGVLDSVSSGRIMGIKGPIAHLVTLGLEQEPDKARLALNTYCRPFLLPPHFIGIWCPEGRNIRLTCFDPDQLKSFDLAEVAGWFKPSVGSNIFRDASACGF